MPVFAQIAVGAVLLDFSTGYVAHRLLHMWPAMWRFHRIHHSDEFVDVTTTYRTHPVESVWRFLFAIAPVWAVGIPAEAVVIQRLLQATGVNDVDPARAASLPALLAMPFRDSELVREPPAHPAALRERR